MNYYQLNNKWVCLLVFSLVFSLGCEGRSLGKRETGALTGGALGAGLGAIIGNQTGSSGAGIAIGSAIGALSGALIGNELDNENDRIETTEQQILRQEQELEQNRRLIEELKRGGADAYGTSRGVVVNLPDVLFDFGSAKLNTSDDTVEEISRVISSVPDRNISVEGHTDSVGTNEYNQRLSEARARSVSQALINRGVSRRRIHSKGLGESDPIASNSTDVGRERNRRVEVIIENSGR
jgi:outer membrane protein OmpA-like peptidoglycan-associated protein